MCNPASFVLTKDRVYWSLVSDSHSAIIDEYKLHAYGILGANVVAVEITPPDDDMSRPLNEWEFRVDEGYPVPEWWDAGDGERRARAALVDWAAALLVTSGSRELTSGRLFASGSAMVEASGLAMVRASGSAMVEASDSATVRAYDSATVRAYDSATVEAYDSATVEAYYSATVRAHDSAKVEACDSATVIRLSDNVSVTLDGLAVEIDRSTHGKVSVRTEAADEAF